MNFFLKPCALKKIVFFKNHRRLFFFCVNLEKHHSIGFQFFYLKLNEFDMNFLMFHPFLMWGWVVRARNLDYFAPDRGAGIFKILQDP